MLYELTDPGRAAALFGDWQETCIWSCLQNIMGKVFADDCFAPTLAVAMLGDFAFFAGRADERALEAGSNYLRNCSILVPQTEEWKTAILDFFGASAHAFTRYAMKKEGDTFDREKLEEAVRSLPSSYRLAMIGEALYERCKEEAWSADLTANFPTYEKFRELGIGVVAMKDGQIVSGASSYSRYREGIEIEIDSREDFRRKGLAYICAAKLILECLAKGLYPSWDAHNKASAALAKKLGYRLDGPYTAIEITRKPLHGD